LPHLEPNSYRNNKNTEETRTTHAFISSIEDATQMAPAAPADDGGDAGGGESGGTTRDRLADQAHSIDVDLGDDGIARGHGLNDLSDLNGGTKL
jgi:hypothetical protein